MRIKKSSRRPQKTQHVGPPEFGRTHLRREIAHIEKEKKNIDEKIYSEVREIKVRREKTKSEYIKQIKSYSYN